MCVLLVDQSATPSPAKPCSSRMGARRMSNNTWSPSIGVVALTVQVLPHTFNHSTTANGNHTVISHHHRTAPACTHHNQHRRWLTQRVRCGLIRPRWLTVRWSCMGRVPVASWFRWLPVLARPLSSHTFLRYTHASTPCFLWSCFSCSELSGYLCFALCLVRSPG